MAANIFEDALQHTPVWTGGRGPLPPILLPPVNIQNFETSNGLMALTHVPCVVMRVEIDLRGRGFDVLYYRLLVMWESYPQSILPNAFLARLTLVRAYPPYSDLPNNLASLGGCGLWTMRWSPP